MDDVTQQKMKDMLGPCACGSGQPGKNCCMKADADAMKTQSCPCGSGKMAKDCCMADAESHM